MSQERDKALAVGRGRRPKPAALKVLEGNPGKRPLNEREPKFEGAPECPRGLPAGARKEWRRIVSVLSSVPGLLNAADTAVLVSYCTAYAEFLHAVRETDKTGGPVLVGPNGGLFTNPWKAQADRAAERLRKLLPELGLSPSARAKLQAPAQAESDDLADFLSEGRS